MKKRERCFQCQIGEPCINIYTNLPTGKTLAFQFYADDPIETKTTVVGTDGLWAITGKSIVEH